jgi:hypothetical protein
MQHKTRLCLAALAVLSIWIGACKNGSVPQGTRVGDLSSTKPTGTIKGRVVYEDLDGKKPSKPMPNVEIVLCRVSEDKGLPDGPVVGIGNVRKVERLCTIPGHPTSISDIDGGFTITHVPTGTYLLLYHLWPNELSSSSTGWNDINLTEAVMDTSRNEILASGKQDFWETGGLGYVQLNFARGKGLRVTKGSVCSKKWGFCFSLHDERPRPVVTVRPDSTIDSVLPIYVKPKEK